MPSASTLDRHDPCARRRERDAHWRISRIFDRHDGLVGHDEDTRDQVERLLRARCDQHVVGAAGHRTRQTDMLDDRLAQAMIALVTLWASRGGRDGFELAELLRHGSAEGSMRKQSRIDQRRAEVGDDAATDRPAHVSPARSQSTI